MNTTGTLQSGKSDDRRNGILYPTMLIAAIAVIVFSVVGIAAITGLIPGAQSNSERTAVEPPRMAPAQNTPAPRTVQPRAAAPGAACVECGVVESVRAVQAPGQGSGLGAVAGGVVGGLLGNQIGGGRGRTATTVVGAGAGAYAGHEIEKNMNKSVVYQIRVRMNDGTYRTFSERSQSAFTVGQKVRVADGRLVAAN